MRCEFYNKEYFRQHEKIYYPINFLRDRIIIWFIKRFLNPGSRILEIGCGTGNLLKMLEKRFDVFGIDLSPYAIKVAKMKLRRGKVFVGDIKEKIDFPIKFDGVIAINVLEHIDCPKKVLQNISNSLKDKGYLFLHLPTKNNFFSHIILKFFFKDHTHVFIPSINELKDLLSKTGFSFYFEAPATLLLFWLNSQLLITSLPIYFGIFQKL